MKDKIARYSKELRLGRVIENNYQNIEAETHEKFLVELLEIMLSVRRTNRRNRLLKQAKFDIVKTFQDYTFENVTLPKNITVENLKEGTFIEHKENLILYGPVGRGKTHLATAIGVNACNRGQKVRFWRTGHLVNQLIKAKKEGRSNVILDKIRKLDLLICDEWGYIPIDTQGTRLLFEVIAECYEKRSVIITTNIEFGKWNNIFYDEKITTAIIDRLVHHGHLLLFTGESYRLKNSMIKKQGK